MSELTANLEAIGKNGLLRYSSASRIEADACVQSILGSTGRLTCLLTPAKDDEDREESPSRDDDDEVNYRIRSLAA